MKKQLKNEDVSEIKRMLNEIPFGSITKSVKEISIMFGLPPSVVYNIYRGTTHENIEPLVEYNSKNIERRKNNSLYNIPEFPKIFRMELQDQDAQDWIVEKLKERQTYLENKVAKMTLLINALKTEDYSDLPASVLEELKSKGIEKQELTATTLKEKYEADLKTLQDNCEHHDKSNELPYYWAPGHQNGTCIQCKTCLKILIHNNELNYEKFEITTASSE